MADAQAAMQIPASEMQKAGIDVVAIPRLNRPTAEDLRAAISRPSVPTIFTGLCNAWPARTAWTPENLRRTHGHKMVSALINLPTHGVLYPQDQGQYERTLAFAEFLDLIMTVPDSSPCYLAYQRADRIFEDADYDFEALTGARDGDSRVWIGSGGTRSMLHSDLRNNLFCQIWGRKRVTLLPWKYTRFAYPFPDNIVNSQLDLAEPDVLRFPKLKKAPFLSSILEPGDILLIPRGCWHDIRACTPSISINHWFGDPQSARDYLLTLLTLGPKYWRRTARDLVVYGLFARHENVRFFFSPPSTGKRLYDALRGRGFSHENDPLS